MHNEQLRISDLASFMVVAQKTCYMSFFQSVLVYRVKIDLIKMLRMKIVA